MNRHLHFPDSCPVFKILIYFLAGISFLNTVFVADICLTLNVSKREYKMYAVVEVRTCHQTSTSKIERWSKFRLFLRLEHIIGNNGYAWLNLSPLHFSRYFAITAAPTTILLGTILIITNISKYGLNFTVDVCIVCNWKVSRLFVWKWVFREKQMSGNGVPDVQCPGPWRLLQALFPVCSSYATRYPPPCSKGAAIQVGLFSSSCFSYQQCLWIRDILVRIRILGSIPPNNGSGSSSGSDSFFQWRLGCKNFCFFIFLSHNLPTGTSSVLKI